MHVSLGFGNLSSRGASLISCSPAEEGFLADDPSDPSRKMIRQVLRAVSEYERSLISLRLRMGRAAKAERGGYAFGAPGYGTTSRDGQLVADAEEAAAIKFARKLRGKGASYRDICRALEDAGHKPRRSDRWHPQVVSRILARS